MAKDQTVRICLWASPRNISTALMYSFAQRTDTQVVDEPFYGFYLSHTKAHEYHPGAQDIINSQENDGYKVIDWIMGPHKSPVLFLKNMTHHMMDLDRSFTKEVVNVILTRDPEEMIPSFLKIIENPVMKDLGYEDQADLFKTLLDNGAKTIVIDSKDVLQNPDRFLKKLCQEIGISFQKEMLKWEPGARKEDGVWAKYWYGNIHQSNGFQAYRKKEERTPEQFKKLMDDCLPLYEFLKRHALV